MRTARESSPPPTRAISRRALLAGAAAAPLAGLLVTGQRARGDDPIRRDPLWETANPVIAKARDAALDVLGPSPSDLQAGLEIHRRALVFDFYGFAPRAAPDTARLAAAAEAGASPAQIGVPQDATRATRAPRLTKQDGTVDWARPAAWIERQRRALEPWPRATTFFTRGDGTTQRLVLGAAEVVASPPVALAMPGDVLDTAGGRLVVACGQRTALAITQVVPEGRRSMSAADFLRGSPLLPGMRLG